MTVINAQEELVSVIEDTINMFALADLSSRDLATSIFSDLVAKFGEPTIEERNYVIVGRNNPVKEPKQRRLSFQWQGVK